MSLLDEVVRDGHPWLTLGSVAALVGAAFVERALIKAGARWYFQAGFPLDQLVPLPRPPTAEEGRTATVRWARRDDVVLFWVEPGERGGPMGLHGAVRLMRRRGIEMVVTWSPPWTPLLAAVWLAALGAVRHEWVTTPIACVLVLVVLFTYRQAAMRAAAELRWAFVSGEED